MKFHYFSVTHIPCDFPCGFFSRTPPRFSMTLVLLSGGGGAPARHLGLGALLGAPLGGQAAPEGVMRRAAGGALSQVWSDIVLGMGRTAPSRQGRRGAAPVEATRGVAAPAVFTGGGISRRHPAAREGGSCVATTAGLISNPRQEKYLEPWRFQNSNQLISLN